MGLDLGDKYHHFCVLDGEGCVIKEGKVSATLGALRSLLAAWERTTVAMEAGTHSPWVSREAQALGHRVLVGNPRKLRMIYASAQKCDERDAAMLARIARFDPRLLCPIRHRGRRAQAHLAILKSRDALVRARTMLINHCRGIAKSAGERLRSSSAAAFARKVGEGIPEDLRAALGPVVETIGDLTNRIKGMERQIEELCQSEYAETERLRGIKGVGPITSLAFVLTIEQRERFAKSRAVAAYLGLTPRRDQSGEVDKQLRITKAGDLFLRRLLISCAHYILGPFGEDSDLRRWGLRLCARGGKNAKKRATVAVARKLAVVLHRLWGGEKPYEAFHHSQRHKRSGRSEQAA
jgi:transposase